MIIKILTIVYKLIPSISLLLLLTEKLEKRGEYEHALGMLNDRIIHGEKSYRFYVLKFRINYLNEQICNNDEALDGYIKLLRFAEKRKIKREVLTGNIIELYNKMKRPSDAIELFKQHTSLKSNSINKEIYFNIGNSYLEIDDFDEAIDHYCKSISIGNDKNPDLLFNIGLAYYNKSNYKDCELAFIKALKYVETDYIRGEIYYSLGVLYVKIQNTKNAEKSFNKALELGYKKALEGLEEIKDGDSIS
jgi:tetratricopeptide (TPR) repeat protein